MGEEEEEEVEVPGMSAMFEDESSRGLSVPSHFTQGLDLEGVLHTSEWELFDVQIKSEHTKEIIFEQKDVEFPVTWSSKARTIVADKYFRVIKGERETSLKQVIRRVAKTMGNWGWKDGYFLTEQDRDIFVAELAYIILKQFGAFNSPVFFNVGTIDRPQCSACFIISVEDDMSSITKVFNTEGHIFKNGSGTGINVSKLRGGGEPLSRGGYSSGPLEFMAGWDRAAGAIKSGGSTRRAAKMIVMDDDHPDVFHGIEAQYDFIGIKSRMEDIAWAIHESTGMPITFNAPENAYQFVGYQNENHSVRISDAFMNAVEEEGEWATKFRISGETARDFRARAMFRKIAEATWRCGDPGIQFGDIINLWHTCKESGEIRSSNPCSEFVFLDDSSCNLASINLLKFLYGDGTFDIDGFLHTVRILTIAQDIIVDNSSYPIEEITNNSHQFRPLGLGYTNLGSLLMAMGLSYDSDQGRALASAVTSLLTAKSYSVSQEMAEQLGPFERWEENQECMERVINKHFTLAQEGSRWFNEGRGNIPDEINRNEVICKMWLGSIDLWEDAWKNAKIVGFRNAQTTLMAPTGTISFMMDASSTGMEPLLGLVMYKQLVGEGEIQLKADVIEHCLKTLEYQDQDIETILNYIDNKETVEGCKTLKDEHLLIFDCSFPPALGRRSLEPMAHIRMMEAIQPFISGAMSKTVNVPRSTTVEEIEQLYMEAWTRGLKSISIYRDGSKGSQPLNVRQVGGKESERRVLPPDVLSRRHKFNIGAHKGYFHMGFYPEGNLGEIFIEIGHEGGLISGLSRAFGMAVSFLLQQGVSLKWLCSKFLFDKFEPRGSTGNRLVPFCDSPVDYMFRVLAFYSLEEEDWVDLGIEPRADVKKFRKDLLRSIEAYRERYLNGTDEDQRESEFDPKERGDLVAPLGVCSRCGSTTYPVAGCETCFTCYSSSTCS
jgi:ribonucleoside-diphosphate reductase alpha chain